MLANSANAFFSIVNTKDGNSALTQSERDSFLYKSEHICDL